MGLLGIIFATLGLDPLTGIGRFDFGSTELSLGFEIVPVTVGLFGIGEILISIEGLILGTKVGIKPEVLFNVISSSGGNSVSLQRKAPRILDSNFRSTFALDLGYKNLYLATLMAQELKTPIFLGTVGKQLFEMARAKGLGSEDNIALVKVFEELSNVKVRR